MRSASPCRLKPLAATVVLVVAPVAGTIALTGCGSGGGSVPNTLPARAAPGVYRAVAPVSPDQRGHLDLTVTVSNSSALGLLDVRGTLMLENLSPPPGGPPFAAPLEVRGVADPLTGAFSAAPVGAGGVASGFSVRGTLPGYAGGGRVRVVGGGTTAADAPLVRTDRG